MKDIIEQLIRNVGLLPEECLLPSLETSEDDFTWKFICGGHGVLIQTWKVAKLDIWVFQIVFPLIKIIPESKTRLWEKCLRLNKDLHLGYSISASKEDVYLKVTWDSLDMNADKLGKLLQAGASFSSEIKPQLIPDKSKNVN